MASNGNRAFRYTALGLRFLEKLLGSKLNVTGIENLPNQPILFVSNHFTRFETFLIPYIIYKYTGRQVRCLADDGLFIGILGRFLSGVGAMSTKNVRRDETIISDLICGRYDWMIYPEGSMIKGKEIYNQGRFFNKTSHGLSTTKTGSAVLGLKSELYRKGLIEAWKNKWPEMLTHYKTKYDLKYDPSLEQATTYVVPVNITYYPIRPGKNVVQKMVGRFLKTLPKQIAEELEIEGNLILSADVDITFATAINLSEYSKQTHDSIDKIPIIKDELKNNLVLRYLKYNLTAKFMAEIYYNTKINIDHLFASILHYQKEDVISISHLKHLIYLSASTIRKIHKFKINYNIEENNLFKILIDEPHHEFDDVVKLAKSQNIISESEDGKNYIINQINEQKKYEFHEVRIENTLQVIRNEFLMLGTANNIIRKNIAASPDDIVRRIFDELSEINLKIYKDDYQKYYDAQLSKLEEVGAPFFLDHKDGAVGNNEVGIVLCHGYQSSPKETEGLANYLNNLGFKIYSVRLQGHGTAPRNLNDASYNDWYDSVQRGYAILKTICSKVIIVGFSTGGLLALLSASRKNNGLEAIVSINPAFKLKDIRTKIIPGITLWNDLLEKLKIKKGRLEYVNNVSESPLINYSQNYLNGVKQLELLIEKCRENLNAITTPTLMIQAIDDPVVDGKISGKIITEIGSKVKKLVGLNMDNHIIIIGKNSEKVFEEIRVFLKELDLLTKS